MKKLLIILLCLLFVGCCVYITKPTAQPEPPPMVALRLDKLEKWLLQLDHKEITAEDFAGYVRDEIRLAKMRELTK